MPTIQVHSDLSRDAVKPAVFLFRQEAIASTVTYKSAVMEPRLQVQEVHIKAGGDISTAKIRLNLEDWNNWSAGNPGRTLAENYSEIAAVDDVVYIGLPYTHIYKNDQGVELNKPPSVRYGPMFVGFLADPKFKIGPKAESVEFTVYGLENRLNDRPVGGRTMRLSEHDAEVMTFPLTAQYTLVGWVGGREQPANDVGDTVAVDLPLIFNPDGKPNATTFSAKVVLLNPSSQTATVRSPDFPVFEAVERMGTAETTAKLWTLADAVNYLLWCYNPDESYVKNPNAKVVQAWMGSVPISNVDLRGTDRLLPALRRLLAGTEFTFVCDRMAGSLSDISGKLESIGNGLFDGTFVAQLRFIKRQGGPLKELYLPAPGGRSCQ